MPGMFQRGQTSPRMMHYLERNSGRAGAETSETNTSEMGQEHPAERRSSFRRSIDLHYLILLWFSCYSSLGNFYEQFQCRVAYKFRDLKHYDSVIYTFTYVVRVLRNRIF